ncbi:porin [Polynucleobacter sp. CS-Odin-A6]|uniref:porin n=1 Tax=Polynucleobacter sp. CS-Odin-A6 TaxID=2689106 RepID=UPI001C0BC7FE|nr:porin [Polynucleobacter sp. CS-Odin-A6]MBU3621328.1 porin [Polynucleobacter sp. CS-Odin-A6]
MKKSLFAVAAMSAIAGAAQAQSSVTVYGVVDAGFIGSNATAYSKTGGNAGTTGGNVKTTTSQFGQGAESTSRLGFKGMEDLGGGTSAFFTVEAGLTPANANLSGGTAVDAVQGTSTDSGSALNNRQSFVGLKKNGLGQFAFGRQYTPIFDEAAKTDPTAYMNMTGGVIYVGGNQSGAESGQSTNIGFTNRASNALTAASDTFAGFQVKGMYAMNNSNSTQVTSSSGGNNNWNGWALGANYTWQKLYVTANYQSFSVKASGVDSFAAVSLNIGGANSPVYAQSAAAITTTAGLLAFTNLADKQQYVGATYDFGILKAYGQWIGRKVTQNSGLTVSGTATSSSTQFNRNAQQIGVRSYITPTIEAWASIGNGRYKGADSAAGVAPATVNFTAYQIGSNYYLSKRTNLYAAFGSTTSTSASSVAGSGTNGNQYAVGARHTF